MCVRREKEKMDKKNIKENVKFAVLGLKFTACAALDTALMFSAWTALIVAYSLKKLTDKTYKRK